MEIRVPRHVVASPALTGLIQLGVNCPGILPTTVTEFITEQLGWEPEYLKNRILTIFLDGQVVDDPDAAVVLDGAQLGLSGAMPGLVGATLRRAGYYAAMRAEISWAADGSGAAADPKPGSVEVRLYNMILADKTDELLARGILVDDRQLIALLGDVRAEARRASTGSVYLLRTVDEPDRDLGVTQQCEYR